MKEKEFKIKFIPTGNVFTLPEAEIDEILKNDRGNYQVLDKKYKYKKTMTKIPELTVLDQVLDSDEKEKPQDNTVSTNSDEKDIEENANSEDAIESVLENEKEE